MLRRQRARGVPSVYGVAGFDEQDLRPLGRDRLVVHAAWHDVQPTRTEGDLRVIQPDRQRARQHEEDLIGLWMAVSGELPLRLDHSQVVVVQRRHRARRPGLIKAGQDCGKVHWLDHQPSLRLRTIMRRVAARKPFSSGTARERCSGDAKDPFRGQDGAMARNAVVVVTVSRDGEHRVSKAVTEEIVLLAGLGVQDDAHAGASVQHRSAVAADPTQPNLRQVHVIHAELHAELRAQGFDVGPGQLGENILTAGVDLLGLPRGTLLHLGAQAVFEVTGLRNPCAQLDVLQPGLLRAVVGRDQHGEVVRKAGIMGIVVHGGPVRPGDTIEVRLPAGPQHALERV